MLGWDGWCWSSGAPYCRVARGSLTGKGPTHTAVSQVLDGPAERIFAVLRDPRRHPELDTTDFLRHAATPDLIVAVGDIFVLAVHNDERGHDRVEYHVVTFAEDRVIGWAPGRPGQCPTGHRFTWKLTPTDADRTG